MQTVRSSQQNYCSLFVSIFHSVEAGLEIDFF